MVKILSMFWCSIFLASCAGVIAEKSIIKVANILTTDNDGVSSEFCADFSLTKDEAQYFFDRAKQVSTKDIHDNYYFLPCFVTGEGYLNNEYCEWEIRAGGTSSIVCKDQSIFLACEDCLPTPK